MKPLAENPQRMQRSGIRVLMDMAAGMPGVIHLEIGQPDFETPAHIVAAACQAAREGFTRYTPNAGLASLREIIVRKLRVNNQLDVAPDNVVVTPGGMVAMSSTMMALLDAGDEVLISDPGWPNYEMAAAMIGATAVNYSLRADKGYLPDLDELSSLLSDRSKLIVLNSPCNPTGIVYPEELVRQIVEFAAAHDLYVLADEIYEDMVFDGSHASAARFDKDGRVVSIFGVSKSYSMTGWRLGYAVASDHVAPAIAMLQEPLVACASGISQKAAEAAIDGPQECVRDMCAAYESRRNVAVEILKQNGQFVYFPQGTFYMLVDISGCGMNSYEFACQLLQEKRVAVAPGGTFGAMAKSVVRVSLVTGEQEVAEGMTHLCEFVTQCRQRKV